MSTIEVRYQRVRGGHLPARSDRNVAQTFLATVARLGDGVALRDPAHGAELSWNQWRDRVAATAAGLAKLGVSKGDTVALAALTVRPASGSMPQRAMPALAVGAQ